MTPLQPPPSCLLTRSLVPRVISEPLFLFQSFTKNSFSSPFYKFTIPRLPSCPHICSSITRLGVVGPRESCDPLREEKGEVCIQRLVFWSSWEVKGQLNADRVGSSSTRDDSLLLFGFLFSHFLLQFLTIGSFFSAARPLVWPRCLPSKPEAGCD